MRNLLIIAVSILLVSGGLSAQQTKNDLTTEDKIKVILDRVHNKWTGTHAKDCTVKGCTDCKVNACMVINLVKTPGLPLKDSGKPMYSEDYTASSSKPTKTQQASDDQQVTYLTQCLKPDQQPEATQYYNESVAFVTKYKSRLQAEPRDVYHMFKADEIINDKLGCIVGCTGDARVFVYYAKKLGLDVRYVVTALKEDYRKQCPAGGTLLDNKLINGHQIVAVKFTEDNLWRLINTSSPDLNYALKGAAFGTGDDPLIAEKVQNAPVRTDDLSVLEPKDNKPFEIHFISNGMGLKDTYIITAILKRDNVFSHKTLMNYYVSGRDNSNKCSWSF